MDIFTKKKLLLAATVCLSLTAGTATAQELMPGYVTGLGQPDPLLIPIENYKPYDPERGLRDEQGAASVFFPVGSSTLDIDYAENANVLLRSLHLLRYLMNSTEADVHLIRVVGLASIEGPAEQNSRLAAARAQALKAHLQRLLPQLGDDLFELVNGGEAWGELISQMEEVIREPLGQPLTADQARGVLKYVYLEPDPDEREQLIRNMDDGHLWPAMQRLLANQRNTGFLRIYYGPHGERPVRVLVPEEKADEFKPSDDFEFPSDETDTDTVFTHSSEQPVASPCEFHPLLALRTNLLMDAILIPNAGIEVALGRNFTLGADWHYAWWTNVTHHLYWQTYGGYLTLRRYFGSRANEPLPGGGFAYAGHHLGVYGSMLTYDIELGGRGQQAPHWGFGGGIEYGYSLPLRNRRLCFDFTLGLGFQDGKYYEYEPEGDDYVWRSTHRRQWWGPTKAEASLKWLLGCL